MPLTLDQATEDFILALRSRESNRIQHTIDTYAIAVRQLCAWFEQQQLPTVLSRIVADTAKHAREAAARLGIGDRSKGLETLSPTVRARAA